MWVPRLFLQALQVCFGSQFFTSQVSLGFGECLLIMFLSRYGLLLWSIFGWVTWSSSKDRDVPLAETIGWDCWLCSLPSEGIRWAPWLPVFSSQTSYMAGTGYYESPSLFWQDSRMGPRSCTACCLGTWIRPEYVLNSLVRWDHLFCSVDRGSHRLCILLSCSLLGLLNGLCYFPGVLVKFPCLTSWRL